MWRTALLSLILPTVAFAGFRVSSFNDKNSTHGGNYWNVASALDGQLETCWMIDPEAEPVGQWIEIDLPNSEVDKLGMVVGWAKSEETFQDYARVKSVRLEAFTIADASDKEGTRVFEENLSFEDKSGWQVMDLPNKKVGSEFFGGKVRVTITEIYEGQDYPYLAVSEVRVHLKEMEARESFRGDPPAGAPDHGGELLLDEKDSTYWLSPGEGAGATINIGADGFGLSRLGIDPGPAQHARPKTVKIFASGAEKTATLENSDEMQWVELPALIGYTGSAWGTVEITVVDTYPGSSGSQLAIEELVLKSTNYEGL